MVYSFFFFLLQEENQIIFIPFANWDLNKNPIYFQLTPFSWTPLTCFLTLPDDAFISCTGPCRFVYKTTREVVVGGLSKYMNYLPDFCCHWMLQVKWLFQSEVTPSDMFLQVSWTSRSGVFACCLLQNRKTNTLSESKMVMTCQLLLSENRYQYKNVHHPKLPP